jgi:hypothetical protein
MLCSRSKGLNGVDHAVWNAEFMLASDGLEGKRTACGPSICFGLASRVQ